MTTGMVLCTVMLGLGCMVTVLMTALLLLGGGTWHVDSVSGALIIYGFLSVYLVSLWRLAWTGIFVRGGEVRVRHRLRTRTVPVTEVTAVEVGPAWRMGLDGDWEALWLRLADGTRYETPVQRIPGWGPRRTGTAAWCCPNGNSTRSSPSCAISCR